MSGQHITSSMRDDWLSRILEGSTTLTDFWADRMKSERSGGSVLPFEETLFKEFGTFAHDCGRKAGDIATVERICKNPGGPTGLRAGESIENQVVWGYLKSRKGMSYDVGMRCARLIRGPGQWSYDAERELVIAMLPLKLGPVELARFAFELKNEKARHVLSMCVNQPGPVLAR